MPDLFKSEFLNKLVLVKAKEASSIGQSLWIVEQEFIYYSAFLQELVVVPKGFETDLASVPRIPLAYWLTGNTAQASAVVHDYLCKVDYKNKEMSWATAARVFQEAMEVEGVPAWRRKLMYWAVKFFGEASQ